MDVVVTAWELQSQPVTQLRGHSQNPGCSFYKNGRACIKKTRFYFPLKVFQRELCVWHRSLCVLQLVLRLAWVWIGFITGTALASQID